MPDVMVADGIVDSVKTWVSPATGNRYEPVACGGGLYRVGVRTEAQVWLGWLRMNTNGGTVGPQASAFDSVAAAWAAVTRYEGTGAEVPTLSVHVDAHEQRILSRMKALGIRRQTAEAIVAKENGRIEPVADDAAFKSEPATTENTPVDDLAAKDAAIAAAIAMGWSEEAADEIVQPDGKLAELAVRTGIIVNVGGVE
jgi:hypothetical protein